MSIEDNQNTSLPMEISGPISQVEVSRCFVPRSDLTYRKLEGLTVVEADLYQSLFTGSLIRDCIFNRVRFNRSDLDGLRVEGSTFIECDFTTCDIRSSLFSRCKFEQCILNDSFVDDCHFQGCELTDCSFKNAITSHCNFHDTLFRACGLSPGTFLHNKMYNCSISEMILGDCTLLYLILRNCTLEHISINAESVGAIFGLTRKQLSDAEIVYLGEKAPIPEGSDVVDLTYDEYKQRKWFLGQLVLALNYGLLSTVGAFDNYLRDTHTRFAEIGFAKGDEIQFLGDLLQELEDLERLPLLAVLNCLEWCSTLENGFTEEDASARSGDSLRTFASRAVFLTSKLVDKLEQNLPEGVFKDTDVPLLLRATFVEKPDIALHEVLNSVSVVSTFELSESSYLIRSEKGSYAEIVYTTLMSVLAFQIFLFLINGCVIQLTELKQRLKVLSSKSASKPYRDLALVPLQQASPVLLSALRSLSQYAKGLPWLKETFLSGYVGYNIQSLTTEDPKELTPRHTN